MVWEVASSSNSIWFFLKQVWSFLICVYNHNNITLYALAYVDEILITGSSSKLIHDLMNKLNMKFSLKQLGLPRYFLGVNVHSQSDGSLLLAQTKYIHDLPNKFTMTEAKGVDPPMMSTCKLRKHGSYALSDPLFYCSTVLVLQYLTLTRLDIAFIVKKACQFMA